jgi:hypothetical protein
VRDQGDSLTSANVLPRSLGLNLAIKQRTDDEHLKAPAPKQLRLLYENPPHVNQNVEAEPYIASLDQNLQRHTAACIVGASLSHV